MKQRENVKKEKACILILKVVNAEHKSYPVIRLVEVLEVKISIDCKLGQENAMQASIVASTSLQHPRYKNISKFNCIEDIIVKKKSCNF